MNNLKELEARWRERSDSATGRMREAVASFQFAYNSAIDELAALREAMRAEVETWPHDYERPAEGEVSDGTEQHELSCRRCRILRFIEGGDAT